MTTLKDDLIGYLQQGREVMVWKLEGLDDYDLRRPLTPTGTNLLGLVKHLASVELGYFGDCVGRPSGIELPWFADEAEPNADMWATADESRDEIVALYRAAWAHADLTFAELGLDAPARVPWWGDRGEVTLGRLLIHMINETARHCGHADIVREMIDGAAGHRRDVDNMGAQDAEDFRQLRERLETLAESFRVPPGR